MASFNYDGKKASDVGLTCRCHLSNVMPDSILHNSVGWEGGGVTFFPLRDGNCCHPQHIIDGFSLTTITPVGVRKL